MTSTTSSIKSNESNEPKQARTKPITTVTPNTTLKPTTNSIKPTPNQPITKQSIKNENNDSNNDIDIYDDSTQSTTTTLQPLIPKPIQSQTASKHTPKPIIAEVNN